MDSIATLSVGNLEKSYGGESVLRDVCFQLNRGETLAVLGRSGSGKTTLLKIIAGLETPDGGEIKLNGQNITLAPPQSRGIVYLYQEPLLLPHLNLWDNMAFGLKLQKLPADQIRTRIGDLVKALDLEGHEKKMPHQLSGGQRQRTAFGRAVSIRPNVLLLDEPFGALDAAVRSEAQDLFQKIVAEFAVPSLFVTHDLKEAILMGNRVGSMQKGQLKIYRDRAELLADEALGVGREIEFWTGLKQAQNGSLDD